MTKAELVEKVAAATGFTKTETTVICENFLDAIKSALGAGHNIEIRKFGTFKIKKRKPRIARNPRTGDAVPISERFIPVFKPSNEFKALIRQEGED